MTVNPNDWDGDLWVCQDCYVTHHYGARYEQGRWYAGDADWPCDREPLSECDGLELADNTNSETGDGIDEFSRNPCDGCGSSLGGYRYRLAYKVMENT